MDTYDFTNKQLYRARRESAFERMTKRPKKLRTVAYLDTSEALDTLSYLRRGYSPSNLWAINRNPAECAHITMRVRDAGFAPINTVGLDFEDALNRRVPETDVIDFDGMACTSDKLLLMLSRVAISRPKSVIGVTALAGRESDHGGQWKWQLEGNDSTETVSTSFGRKVRASHAKRVWFLATHGLGSPLGLVVERDDIQRIAKMAPRPAVITDFVSKESAAAFDRYIDAYTAYPCMVHVTDLFWDVYRSISGQPIVWFVASVMPHSGLSLVKALRLDGLYKPHCCFLNSKQLALRQSRTPSRVQ